MAFTMDILRKIYMIYGSKAKEMTMSLMEAAKIKDEIPADAKIGLKPNLVVAKEPESGATTHAGVLEGCIEYLQKYGFKNITIMEGSWVGDNTKRAFRVTGYDKIAEKYDVKLMDLKDDRTRPVDTAIGKIDVCATALDTDYLISLPVLKGHCQTTMTCALKNSKGCLPDREKRHFHSLGLDEPIAALGAALKPKLTIVDSICGDLDFEEGGTPVQTNRMFLGHDQVEIDAFGCSLMGIENELVGYIPLAEKFGAGSRDFSDNDIVYLNSPSDAPAYPKPSGIVSRLTKNVEQKDACSACYGNLVHALYRMEHEYSNTCREHICIGQGFKDKFIDGIGIGRCCNCASQQVMGCPPSAEAIVNTLMKLC